MLSMKCQLTRASQTYRLASCAQNGHSSALPNASLDVDSGMPVGLLHHTVLVKQ